MYRLAIIHLILAGYIYLRAVHPLRWRRGWKVLLALLLLPPALRDPALRYAGGSHFAPDVPTWALCASAVVYVAFLLVFGGVFCGHLVRRWGLRHVRPWGRLAPCAQQRIFNCLHFALLWIALLVSAIGVYEGRALPTVRHVSIPYPLQKPLRIALLSDLHISPTRTPDFARRIVELTNEQQPDIIAIVGDFVDGSPANCAALLEPLRGLRAPLGVYGVSGNHDYYSGYARWKPLLSSYGIRMLDNESIILPEPYRVILAGVTDESAAYEKLPGPDVHQALAGAPQELPLLLLAHRPIVVRDTAQYCSSRRGSSCVQLSGHLHGGLVWGLGWVVAQMDAGYRSGLYRVGDVSLYVSAGAGSSARTPLRLGVPTEITLIDLSPAAQD